MESVPEDDTLLLLRGSDAVSVVTTNAVKNGWQPPRRKKVNFKNINVGRFLRRLSQKARNRLEKCSSLHFFLIISHKPKNIQFFFTNNKQLLILFYHVGHQGHR